MYSNLMNNFFEQQLFTSQYGSYAEDFDLLNRDGSAIWKIWIFFIVFFIGIILGGITFGASQPKKPATERSTGQQILKLLRLRTMEIILQLVVHQKIHSTVFQKYFFGI